MSDSAEGNIRKPGAAPTPAAGGDGAPPALAPEEAEKFAAAFVPSWQFDEAPFAAGPRLSPGELHELSANRGGTAGAAAANGPPRNAAAASTSGPDSEELTAADVDVSGLVPPPGAAATIQTAVIAPPAAAPVQPAPPQPGTPAGVVGAPTAAAAPLRAADPFVPQRTVRMPEAQNGITYGSAPAAAPMRPAPVRASFDSGGVEIPKRSNKWVLLSVAAVVAVAVVALGIHFTSSAPAAPAPPSTAEATPTRAPEDNHIPPPPSPAEVATAAPTVPPETPHVQAAPPPPPPPPKETVAAAPPPPPPPTTRAPSAIARPEPRPSQPRTSAPPKNPPKSPGGGIVRDNPF